MTVVAKTLVEATQAAAADTTVYTCPANTRCILDKVTGTNTTAGALTLTINIVPAAGSVAASNAIMSAQSIAANTAYLCPEIVGQILNAGDFVSVKASAATSITIRLSGREVS